MPAVQDVVAAIQAKDADRVADLVKQDPSLAHARTPDGTSMLLLAAYHRADAAARILLERGVAPDAWEAAAVGRLERLRLLVNADATVGTRPGHDGWTPLHLAAHFGQKEIVSFLLYKGAAPDVRSTNALANTPLHAAIAGGQRTCAAILLQAGADPDATYLGMTALHVAAANGDDAAARLLLQHKARAAPVDKDGRTPLQLAQEKGHAGVVRVLREKLGLA